MTEWSASTKVRSIVSTPLGKENEMARLVGKTAALNDGTTGKRFAWGLYRVRDRSRKTRYGIKFGPTMVGFHMGIRSLYVERKAAIKRLHHFAG